MTDFNDPQLLDVHGKCEVRGGTRIYFVQAGDRNLQVSISPTGSKVRVWLDNKELS